MRKNAFLSLILLMFSYTGFSQLSVSPLTTGRPIATYYLGDKLPNPSYFNYEIDASAWNASEVGIGQNTDGSTGWSWDVANFYQDNGSYKDVRRDLSNFQFTATGTWYVVGRAKANSGDAWTYGDEGGWTSETTLNASTSSGSCPYFTVNALGDPTTQSASTASSSSINLSWNQWSGRNVMIVRKKAGDSWTEPTQGTSYAVNSTIGSGTVVYNSNGTSFTNTALTSSTGYDYKFYSENYTYYSSGVTASAATSTSASDYFQSKATGTWNTSSNWESSPDNITWLTATLAPDASATSTTILNGHSITLASNADAKLLKLNSGGQLDCANFTFNIVSGGTLTNNGTFTAGTGTIAFAGSGTVAGTITFNNVTIAGAVNFGPLPTSTLNGTLRINAGGNVNTHAPIYASGSLLQYFTGNSFNRDVEWSQTSGNAYPYNVQISGATTLNMNSAGTDALRQIAGTLTIDQNSTLDLQNKATGDVVISGDIINNGTVKLSTSTVRLKCTNYVNGSATYTGATTTLSSNIGGDLEVTGNLTDDAVFSTTSRAVFFTGAGVQDVKGTGAMNIDYMVLSKTGGSVRMLNDLLCEGPNTGNALVFSSAADVIDLNGHTLTLGKAGVNSVVTGSGLFRGSSTSSLSILGTGALGTVLFDPTTPGTTNLLQNFSINRTSGGTISLGNDLLVGGTLSLTDGIVTTGTNGLSVTTSSPVTRTNGYVNGSLKMYVGTNTSPITWHIGDATNYTPVALTFTAPTGTGSITIKQTPSVHPNILTSRISSTKYISRYYTLTNDNVFNLNYSALFNFLAGDIQGSANTTNFIVGRYSSGSWIVPYPTVGTTTSTSTQVTGLTGMGDFQIGESGCIVSATASNDGPKCSGTTLGFTGSAANGTGPYSYSWSGPNSFNSTNQNPSISSVTPAATGTYTLTVTDTYNGCTALATTNATVNATPVVTPITDKSYCNGFTMDALLFVSNPAGATIAWTSTHDIGFGTSNAGDIGDYQAANPTSSPILATVSVIATLGSCASLSIPVTTITVNPTPEFVNPDPALTLCSGSTLTFDATTNPVSTTTTWTSVLVTGISGQGSTGTGNLTQTLINNTSSPLAVTYTYTVNSGSCPNTKSFTVSVFKVIVDQVYFRVNSAVVTGVCPGIAFDLHSNSNLGTAQPAELINETFETGTLYDSIGPDGWSTTLSYIQPSNPTGNPDVKPTRWNIQQSPFTTRSLTTPYFSVTVRSIANSKFYISDNSRNLTNPTSSLISKVIPTTVGYTTLTLDFWHYYRDKSPKTGPEWYLLNDSACIDVRVNGGNWECVKTYNETQGDPDAFVQETVNLSAYINKTNVQIRFRFQPNSDYYWAIDNVKVTGTSPITGFTWTASPAVTGFPNSLNVSPPGIRQPGTTTYTATYTEGYSTCTGSASVVVTTHPAPTPAIIFPPGPVSICTGDQINFIINSGAGSFREWNLYGSFQAGQTGTTYTTVPLIYFNPVSPPLFIKFQYVTLRTIDGNGCKAISDTTRIYISDVIGNNTVATAQTICPNTNPVALTGSPPGSSAPNLTGGNPPYPTARVHTYLWESSIDNLTFSDALGTKNGINYSPVALAQTTWLRRKVTSGACSSNTSPPIQITVANTWKGTTSANWDLLANWTCQIPTASTDVIVPIVNSPNLPPQVNITGAVCKNLTINASGSLQINAGQALSVGGNLTNNGTFTINSDALTSNGSLIVAGTSTGNVIYNRYLTNNDRWFITSPPVNNLFQLIGSDVDKVSGTYNFSPYEEANNNGWTYPYNTLPSTLTPGMGYLIKLLSGNTVRYTGTLNGDLSLSLPSSGPDDGWNAIGNPYTSAMRIKDVGTKIGFLTQNIGALDNNYQAVYLWNQTGPYSSALGQQYYCAINNSGYTPVAIRLYNGPLNDSLIQAGQGFLVNIKPGGGTINFKKGSTVTGMQVHSPTLTTMKSLETSTSWPGITLLASNSGRTSSTVVAFHENMTTGLDPSYDAGMLSASDFNIYTHLVDGSNATDFMVQCLPDTWNDTLAVPIGIDMRQAGPLTFKVAGVILPDGLYPVIEDRLLQISAPLKTEADSLTVNVAEPTWGIGRFYLHIGGVTSTVGNSKLPEAQKLSAYFTGQKIIIYGSPEKDCKAWLYDMSGRKLGGEYRLTSANRNEISAAGLASGIYLLKIEGKTGRQTIKVTVLNR